MRRRNLHKLDLFRVTAGASTCNRYVGAYYSAPKARTVAINAAGIYGKAVLFNITTGARRVYKYNGESYPVDMYGMRTEAHHA